MARGWLCVCAFFWVSALIHGAPPEDLSNYQNEYICNPDTRLVRPLTVDDVQATVLRHFRVKAAGTGGSNSNFFCATSPTTDHSNHTSANIIMTAIRPQSIEVNEQEMTAWVSAGVIVWDLIEYLGNTLTPTAPRGYALGETPIHVNMTIAGAIATASHGSSLTHGTLSQQVAGVRVVLANGTSLEILPETHPLLFKAFKVNVGRLGVVTHVKMHIIPETLVQRTFRTGIAAEAFLPMLREAQEHYRATADAPAWLDWLQVIWSPVDNSFSLYTFAAIVEEEMQSPAAEPDQMESAVQVEESMAFLESLEAERINAPVNLTRSVPGGDVADGVGWRPPSPLEPNLAYSDPNITASVVSGTLQALGLLLGNATLETSGASLSLPPALDQPLLLVDEYEVAVPLDKMSDCLEPLLDMILNEVPDNGLRSILLFRFTGAEDGLLSPSYGKPHLWIALPDYVYYNQEVRGRNVPFQKLMAFLSSSPLCAPARLHWGRSGFPDSGCWNGVQDYPETWCDFGCAVRALDPHGKFSGSDPLLWNWEGARLDECCTEHGYDTSLTGCSCSVVPSRSADECPEAPFYSGR